MPGISQIVTTISEGVVAALAEAGYPPLAAGKILLGRQHQEELLYPPRILFIPMKSKFGAPNVSRTSQTAIRQRAIATEFVTFEVRCWGLSPGEIPDADADIDVTQALYHAVILSTHLSGAAGVFTIEGGDWVDAKEGSTQQLRLGREFVFGLTLSTPVVDELLPVAGAGIQPDLSNQMTLPSGATGTGCG